MGSPWPSFLKFSKSLCQKQIQLNSKLNQVKLFLKIQNFELQIFARSEFSMKPHVIMSSLTKFHKLLRYPSILYKFKMISKLRNFPEF
jgi:hypothetical protein